MQEKYLVKRFAQISHQVNTNNINSPNDFARLLDSLLHEVDIQFNNGLISLAVWKSHSDYLHRLMRQLE